MTIEVRINQGIMPEKAVIPPSVKHQYNPQLGQQFSRRVAGRSFQIKKAAEELGTTNIRELSRVTGLTPKQIRRKEPILARWGIEISRGNQSFKAVEAGLKIEEDDRKIQKLLDNASPYSLRNSLRRRSKVESPVLTFLITVLNKTKVHPIPRDLVPIYEEIKLAGIPIIRIRIGTMRKKSKTKDEYRNYPQFCYIMLTKHEERVLKLEALKGNLAERALTGNKIELAYGPESLQSPTTYQLKRKNGDWGSIRSLLLEHFKRLLLTDKIRERGLFVDCPVPIFSYRGNRLYYPSDQKTTLVDFVRKRLEKL